MQGVREVRLLVEGFVSCEVSLSGGGDTQNSPHVHARQVCHSHPACTRGESEWWRGHSDPPRMHQEMLPLRSPKPK